MTSIWNGDYLFLLENLIVKDFKIRYRNMSLGVFWSLLNPLVLMGVLTFVFTKVFPNPSPNFPIFVLCGIVPYNFFTIAWNNGTISVANNSGLIKRIPVPREIVPIASVLSTTIHLGIQIALLLLFVLAFGRGINVYWLWLPVLWILEIIFVCGLVLTTAALDVYLRDMRYIVESACTVLFWLVPVFYGLEMVPRAYVAVYEFNPLAALILGLRRILIDGVSPNGDAGLVYKLAFTSTITFLFGLTLYSRLKNRFFDYL
ncbi:MAG: ABC transporter permease [Saprospiraceae bacterium]